MVCRIHDTKCTEPLFEGWEETLVWSCLQGVMGEIYAVSPEAPVSAMAVIGDFCFFAGRPDRELAGYWPGSREKNFMLAVPQSEEWGQLIEACYGTRAERMVRYAIKKEPGIFNTARLKEAAASLPEGFELHPIGGKLYQECLAQEWSRDLVAQFPTYEAYRKLGLGMAVLKDGEIVSGASSYTRYREGIEIEIDTREDCRRKGLAYACGASLILACLERGLYPSWDAQNKWSVALAEKLGYHFSHEYAAYVITGGCR